MMKHPFSLATALLSLALAATAAAAQPALSAISVSGEASVSVAPDLAQVEGGVTSEAKTAREASDANNAAMGKVLLALKGAGIDEKDYQTSRLSLQPQYAQATQGRTGVPQIAGYRASNRVTIKVRDVTKVAGVIDTLVGAGANEVGGINFVVTQASKALDEARAKAVADARRKAENLRQGRRRNAGRAAQHFRRGRVGPAGVPQQDGRGDGSQRTDAGRTG
jgi:uncharacterized protein